METQKNMQESKETGSTGSKTGAGRKESGGGTATGTGRAATPEAAAGAATQGATQGATGEQAGGQDLLQQAKQTTGEIVNQVQQRAGAQVTRGKESAASDLSSVVNAVRRFGESLAGEANGPIARYAAQYGDKAANNLERLTGYIREQDPKQLLDDVQNFGRRRPAWLLGGAFILGFAGARLIKSSMEAASGQQEFYSTNTDVPAPTLSSPTYNAR